MTVAREFIFGFWILLAVCWAISAVGVKRNIGRRRWLREGGLRLGLIVLALLALRVPPLRHALRVAQLAVSNPVTSGISVAICAIGIALAIWGRVSLGRNWGMPMSRKENPELVTAGPYAFVRHPIYGGILLAMLGSMLGASMFWLLPLVLFGPYFLYSARGEERLMLEQFPGQYAAYMQRTKMLLPFVV